MTKNLLKTCTLCTKEFRKVDICPACQNRDIHWGKKVPKGKCQHCLATGLKLTKAWNNNYYCTSCLSRKGLIGYSTRNLMIEIMERTEFKALLSWEDDGFKQRYGEIMWELEQVKHLAAEKIRELVDEDVIKKPISRRKFSRGN